MSSDETGTDKNLSTRVNAARLPEYVGRHVRLACKILKVRASSTLSSVLKLIAGGHRLVERSSCHSASI